MSFIFGKRKTPAELLRENKRMRDKSIREIERERQDGQARTDGSRKNYGKGLYPDKTSDHKILCPQVPATRVYLFAFRH
ncbi:hypothetical protein GUJ93_ZPchr0011g27309 [Zizania palustris]|uniref:Uncharacterized protein n=1 Tax=Zizania palustris TaxID=103762 RepID=A0A8J6BQP7_ZIZPA|nr:hypothetical protein GUJ93_ZPchr0011g27309 [Zizania palustris]